MGKRIYRVFSGFLVSGGSGDRESVEMQKCPGSLPKGRVKSNRAGIKLVGGEEV